jgi:uncharacterized membrane protein
MKATWKGAIARKQEDARWNLLEIIVFAAFVVWTIAGLIFTLGKITPAVIAQWPVPPWLVAFVRGCLAWGDPVLIILAFANTHLHAARQWSASSARRWAATVIVFAFVIETIGTLTAFPFGDYRYTTLFGPMLGVVPLTIPLAWHVVVTNALFVVRFVAPNLGRVKEALCVGALCTGYDF